MKTANILFLTFLFALLCSITSHAAIESAKKMIVPFSKPDFTVLAAEADHDSILRGKQIVENTPLHASQYVGSKLSCANCHLDSGTTPHAAPWVGIDVRFPQYRSRSGKVDTLSDRVNDCFERSLNGKRLPNGSRELTDILNYMRWLSKGFAKDQEVEGSGMAKVALSREPDLVNGKKVFEAKCAECHQSDGQGRTDSQGKTLYPALWGKNSFNIGAGMARLHTAAGFVKRNMPLGRGGTLSDDEAFDVAAYFTRQERPDFAKKTLDWPKGDKPGDARY